jgi:hypothetical protein
MCLHGLLQGQLYLFYYELLWIFTKYVKWKNWIFFAVHFHVSRYMVTILYFSYPHTWHMSTHFTRTGVYWGVHKTLLWFNIISNVCSFCEKLFVAINDCYGTGNTDLPEMRISFMWSICIWLLKCYVYVYSAIKYYICLHNNWRWSPIWYAALKRSHLGYAFIRWLILGLFTYAYNLLRLYSILLLLLLFI